MNSDIEEIKTRLNVVDILRDYIRLEKAGANWRALCPFHNEKSPSFMVNEEKQFWHCFGCQKSGDIFNFVMEMEGLEFKDALRQLAERAGVALKKTNPKMEAEKNKTLEILELATKFYETQLWKGDGKVKIINYLKERGLKDETIREFRLGYAPPGWRNILTFLVGRGYTLAEIMRTGLLVEKNNQDTRYNNQKISNIQNPISKNPDPKIREFADSNRHYDRFRDRVIFPIADTNGKIVGYSARVAPGGDDSQAKYVNTPETEVYHKSKILYGIDKAKTAIRQNDFALLVEGNMDVIASWQAGLQNTVAVSGTALTPEQIGIIKRYAGKIKMFFDMDKAGEAATKKSLKLAFAQEIAASVVELPEGKDAADLAQKDPEKLKEAVAKAKPAMEYFFQKVFSRNDKNNVEAKKIIAEELLDMIGNLASPIEKGHWVKKLAEELDTAETILTDMLKKATLKEGFERGGAEAQSAGVVVPKTKEEMLMRELSGLMLVAGDVWKKLTERADLAALLAKDRLLSALKEFGQSVDYDFDKLLKKLGSEELAKIAGRFYFEKKYRLGLNNSLEEIAINDPLAEAENILKELQKEERRSELNRIIRDLEAAEKSGDRAAVQFLRTEVKRISQGLAG
jgi:DNA primase